MDELSVITLDLSDAQSQKDATEKGIPETVVDIALEAISSFPSHPFRVEFDASMVELTESVRQFGVLVPAVVRPRSEDNYEMISGHRRLEACRRAGLSTIPCIVRELNDDEAIIIMVDSNLQRESLLPSEKGFAYRMKLEAIRRQQGERTDLTSATSLQKSEKLSSRELLAESSPDSHEQIRKYIRLTYLIPALLTRVDRARLSMRSAVELSYLSEAEQITLNYFIDMINCMPSYRQAVELRRLSEEKKLNERTISKVLTAAKSKKVKPFHMSWDRLGRYFKPGTSDKAIEETIIKALEFYQNRES